MQSDPTRISPHDLKDHYPVVRSCGRVQPIESLSGDIDRSHKSECQFGRGKIVVDRFRHANDRESTFMKLFSNPKCSLAPEYDQGLDLQNIKVCQCLADRHFGESGPAIYKFDKAAAVSGSEHRSTTRQDSADALRS